MSWRRTRSRNNTVIKAASDMHISREEAPVMYARACRAWSECADRGAQEKSSSWNDKVIYIRPFLPDWPRQLRGLFIAGVLVRNRKVGSAMAVAPRRSRHGPPEDVRSIYHFVKRPWWRAFCEHLVPIGKCEPEQHDPDASGRSLVTRRAALIWRRLTHAGSMRSRCAQS
jgi:hypothetical protein